MRYAIRWIDMETGERRSEEHTRWGELEVRVRKIRSQPGQGWVSIERLDTEEPWAHSIADQAEQLADREERRVLGKLLPRIIPWK